MIKIKYMMIFLITLFTGSLLRGAAGVRAAAPIIDDGIEIVNSTGRNLCVNTVSRFAALGEFTMFPNSPCLSPNGFIKLARNMYTKIRLSTESGIESDEIQVEMVPHDLKIIASLRPEGTKINYIFALTKTDINETKENAELIKCRQALSNAQGLLNALPIDSGML